MASRTTFPLLTWQQRVASFTIIICSSSTVSGCTSQASLLCSGLLRLLLLEVVTDGEISSWEIYMTNISHNGLFSSARLFPIYYYTPKYNDPTSHVRGLLKKVTTPLQYPTKSSSLLHSFSCCSFHSSRAFSSALFSITKSKWSRRNTVIHACVNS